MLEALTFLFMLLVALLYFRQGIFEAGWMLVNVLLAGFLAFNFWEPLANLLGSTSAKLDRFADFLCLFVLFILILTLLWVVTRGLARADLGFPPLARQIGGAVFGLITGYVLAGILICVLQTLPLSERFLGYDPDQGIGLGAPDRVWLAMMHRASGRVFDRGGDEERWFDADGSFIPRYRSYRRQTEEGPMINRGEFPSRLETQRPILEESDSAK